MTSSGARQGPMDGSPTAKRSRGSAALLGACLAALLAGCAHFGVPALPPPPGPEAPPADVYVVYHPTTVLGFGHTGVVVVDETGRGYLRFDQYASAEIDYLRRDARGETWFWEGATARLPSIFGFTREYVTRRRAGRPGELLQPGEAMLPVPGVRPDPVREAAEARFRAADGLELDTAPRYFWMGNNCHHFVRDVLRAGGAIPERYFPKHFVEDLLEGGGEVPLQEEQAAGAQAPPVSP